MRAVGGIAVVVVAVAAAPDPPPAVGPRVTTDAGVVEGVSMGAVLSFKGIPYAASPAGAHRWKPPRPAAAWSGIRSAREAGPPCPQPDREPALFRRLTTALGGDPAWVPPLGPTSEDCLSLNVFSPAFGPGDRKPVMVWLHGGANRFGSGKDQAAALARYGAVVVTLNYRLGLLGFLVHPALAAESPHGSSGNYALLDQIEALRWVQRNIAAFGGDPGRVTAFGHSAGGASVAHLLASPLARGLFQRGIIQSGGLGTPRPRAEMEAEGSRIAKELGAPPANPLPALRTLPVEALLATSAPFDPVADGWVVSEAAPPALASGHGNTIPVLVGATADEATVFSLPRDVASYRAAVDEAGPEWKDRVSGLYPPSDDARGRSALTRLMTDRDFVCPARYVAARRRGPTWLYLFSALPTRDLSPGALGAFHGADVRLLFDLTYGVPQGSVGEAVGDAMRRYWVHFAATGEPSPPGLPAWPRYEGKEPRHLRLDDPIEVRSGMGGASCDLFDQMWDGAFAARPAAASAAW